MQWRQVELAFWRLVTESRGTVGARLLSTRATESLECLMGFKAFWGSSAVYRQQHRMKPREFANIGVPDHAMTA